MISLFDLYKIGVGPSSSHTVGPMLAALQFAQAVDASGKQPRSVHVDLYGSLALTGLGHRSDRAVLAGLLGEHPKTVDPARLDGIYDEVSSTGVLQLASKHNVPFSIEDDLVLDGSQFLPEHPNGMKFVVNYADQSTDEQTYFSVGGGFIANAEELLAGSDDSMVPEQPKPLAFDSAEQLVHICEQEGLSIAEVVFRNEQASFGDEQITRQLEEIWEVMEACIHHGCQTEGVLPGGLGVKRRAPGIYSKLNPTEASNSINPMQQMDWVTLFALAVNEENAAGGRVVTAPTNGAAGIIPAVGKYYMKFGESPSKAKLHEYLMTSAAIGMIYKRNASLSAAEMGCQGEVGVACSMAAAGLAAVLGGTPRQVENAAEIGMEHNLGLTCDPVAGLVQVPCIERNAMGAIQAINAARMAVLYGDGHQRVTLDQVIETMRQTGVDMRSKYKETSLGGLAMNVVNC